MMTEDQRYKSACGVAEETIDALMTLYWADSFDADLLQIHLAELILSFTQNARSLGEPHPRPDLLDQGDDLSTTPAISVDSEMNGSANVQAV